MQNHSLHSAVGTGVSVSDDGRLIASSSRDGTVKLFTRELGRRRESVVYCDGREQDWVQVSSRGGPARVLHGCDQGHWVQVSDPETQKAVPDGVFHVGESASAGCWAQDCPFSFFAVAGRELRLFDLRAAARGAGAVAVGRDHLEKVAAVAVTQAGVATASHDGHFRVFDPRQAGAPPAIKTDLGSRLNALAVDAQAGAAFTSGRARKLFELDAATGHIVSTTRVGQAVTTIAIPRPGRGEILIAGVGEHARLLTAQGETKKLYAAGRTGQVVMGVACSQDGTVIATTAEDTTIRWHPGPAAEARQKLLSLFHDPQISEQEPGLLWHLKSRAERIA